MQCLMEYQKRERIESLFGFLPVRIHLFGHNISFDYSFLKKNIEEIGEKFVRKGIDTLKIARKLLPDLEDRSLTNLCHYYQIENTHAHRAKEDAIAAFQLYSRRRIMFETGPPREWPIVLCHPAPA